MKLNCPQPYRENDITYCRHVHYLIEEDDVWSKMKTTRVICEADLEDVDKIVKEKNALIINALDFKYFDKESIPTSVNLPTKKLDKLSKEEKEERVIEFLKESVQNIKILNDKVNSKKLSIQDVPIVVYCAHSKCDASVNLLIGLVKCCFELVLLHFNS